MSHTPGPARNEAGQQECDESDRGVRAVTHTPGPWDCGGAAPFSVWSGNGTKQVAACAWWGDSRDGLSEECVEASEAHANALLISAAPDLLAALKEVVKCADADHGAWSEPGYRWYDAIETARAAIAKADGYA